MYGGQRLVFRVSFNHWFVYSISWKHACYWPGSYLFGYSSGQEDPKHPLVSASPAVGSRNRLSELDLSWVIGIGSRTSDLNLCRKHCAELVPQSPAHSAALDLSPTEFPPGLAAWVYEWVYETGTREHGSVDWEIVSSYFHSAYVNIAFPWLRLSNMDNRAIGIISKKFC